MLDKGFQGMTCIFLTLCHTLRRVLFLASMYSFFIRSAQFHLLFLLCSFLVRKVTCSAGKFLCILLSTPFIRFCFVSVCFLPSLIFEDDKALFPDNPHLTKANFHRSPIIEFFKLDIDVNRRSCVTLILLKYLAPHKFGNLHFHKTCWTKFQL